MTQPPSDDRAVHPRPASKSLAAMCRGRWTVTRFPFSEGQALGCWQNVCSTDTAGHERSGAHPWRAPSAPCGSRNQAFSTARGLGQGRTTLIAAFADTAHMSACGSKNKVFAFAAGRLRQAETRLHRHQNKRVIAPPNQVLRSGAANKASASAHVRKRNERACEAFAQDGVHSLNLRRVARQLEGGVPKERVNGSQHIAASIRAPVGRRSARQWMRSAVVEATFSQSAVGGSYPPGSGTRPLST